MDNIPLSVQLYKCYPIIADMLNYRGYITDNFVTPTVEEINVMRSKDFCEPVIVRHLSDEENIAEVHFLVFKSIKIRDIEGFLTLRLENINESFDDSNPEKETLLQNLKSKRTIIIVTREMPSENIRRYTESFYKENGIYVQIFFIKTLMFDVTKHRDVPHHEIVSEEEANNVIKPIYRLKSKQELPVISKYDPVAMFIGARPGQICKITRVNETSGEIHVFRCCR